MNAAVERLLDCSSRGEVTSAIALLGGLLDEGMAMHTIINDVVAPAQREVGERWARNEWTVADEHRATTASEAALLAVLPKAFFPDPTLGRVLAVCGEEDWHTLPARMGAIGLTSAGWDVEFLGGSLPARHLERELERARPDLVAVHVSLPMLLPAAARTVTCAREIGADVVVGGRAVAGRPERAGAIGATHVATGPGTFEPVDRGIAPGPSAPPVTEQREAEIVEAAVRHLNAADESSRELAERHAERTRTDFAFMLKHLSAAAVTGDATVWTDFYDWLVPLLERRGVPPSVTRASVMSVAAAVADFDEGLSHLATSPISAE